jgi:hypothetical protein
MKISLTILLFALCINTAQARPRYHNTNSQQPKYSYTNNMGSDQERCQAEANYMASNNIKGHVWGTIGNFEGVGYGNSANCNTCTPGSNMRLTGDASAQSSNGMWYRVRSWR